MSDKLNMRTKNITQENVEKIGMLFPHCITEATDKNGEIKHLIDFESLKQELSEDVASGIKERYQFTWPDKHIYKNLANLPVNKTLRPCREESVNFDETENLYIEGDNLDALKLLRETYLEKVKMIYIDPPYNTGNDFVYKDNFVIGASEYRDIDGVYDEERNRLFKNTDANGRFHTDWLNMMYPRLKLARDLLSDDGVIFISIDDSELKNLRNICDEIYGKGNFIASALRRRRDSQANLSKNISAIHEYVLIYRKTEQTQLNRIKGKIDETGYSNPDNDSRGPYTTMPCTNKGGSIYEIVTPTGRIIEDEWRFKRETYDKLLSDGRIYFPSGGNGKPRYKIFLKERLEAGVLANTWWDDLDSNQTATMELRGLLNDSYIFDNPKPVDLIVRLLELGSKAGKDDIILDFFSGSATTAHAVMKLNMEDMGGRRFIMIQLPEKTDEKSDAYKAGYENICEIGKERIRRAGEQLGGGAPSNKISLRRLFQKCRLWFQSLEDRQLKYERCLLYAR